MNTKRKSTKKMVWKPKKLKRMCPIEYIRTHRKIGKNGEYT